VLIDGREHHHRFAPCAQEQEFRGPDAEIRLASQDVGHRVDVRLRFDQAHVETGLAIVPLGERRIVAGKLELMHPLQLQRDGLERLGDIPRIRGPDRRRGDGQPEDQAKAKSTAKIGNPKLAFHSDAD